MGNISYQFASIFDFDGMKSWKYLRTKEDTPSLISKNIALDMITPTGKKNETRLS